MSHFDPLNNRHGLPVLAGLCTFEEAERPGYGVDEAVVLLKRYHWALRRSWEAFISRIASVPDYELKMGFAYHAHLAAENVSLLRLRVAEMREPPLGLEVCPDDDLDLFFQELLSITNIGAFLSGLYEVLLPGLLSDISRYRAETNPLVDAPTLRVLSSMKGDLEEMVSWGSRCLSSLRTHGRVPNPHEVAKLRDCLDRAGGIRGEGERTEKLESKYADSKYQYDGVPRRDERFLDPFNMAVNAETMVYDETTPAVVKALMLLYKRIREIDVPEMMASILAETPGQPWDYYRDMTRQLWDEARHALMGQVGLRSLGLDWSKIGIRHTWSYELNTLLTPRERHAVLYFIEKGLMPKTGKRFEWEIAVEAGNPLLATFQDFDWADEVLHARIGKEWFANTCSSPAEAHEIGDKAWSSIYHRRRDYEALGWTANRNWWPEFYRHACDVMKLEYSETIAAYSASDLNLRADLERAGTSA